VNLGIDGRVALVTGGARNIGRAIARALAAGGATVMVNARTSRAQAEETVAMIEQAGGKAALHIADVTDPRAVAAMVEATVRRFGRLDALVNNAAVRMETPFEQITLEEWRRVLGIVLDGAFICTQACLPPLAKSGAGAIVNIGGLTGHRGATGRAHVIAAKAGLAGMTKALALEVGSRGITVNCVAPGFIRSAMTDALPEAQREALLARVPAGALGEGTDIAAACVYLASREAGYVTGQTLHVNGGMAML
jgi:3-oxoacyl-[acyl-carrier protein] reductase